MDLLLRDSLWHLAAEMLDVPLGQMVFHISNLTRKPAHTGPAIGWHRDADNRYFRPQDGHFLRILIPLDAMSEENGGTGLIPGSHIDCDPDVIRRCRAGNLEDVVWPTLRAGDALVMHPLVLHGGLPNRSGKGRNLLVLQFGTKGAPLKEATMEHGSLMTLEEMRTMANMDSHSKN